MNSDTPRTDAILYNLTEAGYQEGFNQMLRHAEQLERENARLRGALKPFAELAKAADAILPKGTWKFVAQHTTNGPKVQITDADVCLARALLAEPGAKS